MLNERKGDHPTRTRNARRTFFVLNFLPVFIYLMVNLHSSDHLPLVLYEDASFLALSKKTTESTTRGNYYWLVQPLFLTANLDGTKNVSAQLLEKPIRYRLGEEYLGRGESLPLSMFLPLSVARIKQMAPQSINCFQPMFEEHYGNSVVSVWLVDINGDKDRDVVVKRLFFDKDPDLPSSDATESVSAYEVRDGKVHLFWSYLTPRETFMPGLPFWSTIYIRNNSTGTADVYQFHPRNFYNLRSAGFAHFFYDLQQRQYVKEGVTPRNFPIAAWLTLLSILQPLQYIGNWIINPFIIFLAISAIVVRPHRRVFHSKKH